LRQALAEIEVVAIRLGDLILPVLAGIVTFLTTNVGPAIRATKTWFDEVWTSAQAGAGVLGGIVEWFQKVWDVVKPVAETVGRELIEAFQQTWRVLQSNLGPMLAALWSLLQKLWDVFKPLIIVIGIQLYVAFRVITEILPVVIAIITKLIEWLAKIIEGALAVVTFIRDKFVEPIINFLGRLIEWIKDHWSEAWTAMKVVVGVVVGPIVGFINTIINVVKTLFGWIMDVIHAFETLTSLGSNATTLAPGGPRRAGGFQHGGVVTSTGLAMVHKGEVFSGVNNEMGMGGFTGDITLVLDGQVLARITRDQLLKLKARNATTGL
jgi:phage-related protein